MRADHRVLDVRHVLHQLGELAAGGVFLGASAVDGAQAGELSLQLGRKRVVGGGGAGKDRVAERVAVLDRDLARVEERAARRRLGVRHVGVPGAARIGVSDRLAVHDDVGEHEDLGMAGQRELGARADLELAEAAREGDLLLGRERLIAEHQH